MSLKSRLRLAVALLMSAMVVVLSGLYIQSFLDAALTHTHTITDSLAEQVRSTVRARLLQEANSVTPPPVTSQAARDFWLRTVESDPAIQDVLENFAGHWRLVKEIFITDAAGRIRASSVRLRSGAQESFAPDLAEWRNRSLAGNLLQVYWYQQDMQIIKPAGIAGERQPVFNVHVVVSTVILREDLRSGLIAVGQVSIACLMASIVLSLMLPNYILSPLERLGRSIDRMATGEFNDSPPTRGETKEFAAVYSKLNLLGQQVLGAQENVEQLIERLEEAVILFDATGRVTLAGHAVRHLLGRDPSELTGLRVDEVFPASTKLGALVGSAVNEGQPVKDQSISMCVGEQDHPVLVSVQPLTRPYLSQRLGAMVSLRDAETRGEVAAQLDIAKRLTALSQLTRGLAHEIKNPLNAIRLHVEILRLRMEAETPEVEIISREISRLDRVVKTFLDFNRPVEPHLSPIDVNHLAGDLAALIEPDARARNVRVILRTESGPAFVNGDPDLLRQAILNIVVNGMEAMNRDGELKLETHRAGGRVEIVISDTGPGIPPEMQDKIFNLYFTTKQHGSGIGLAMAFRLIQVQDGRIEFSTEAGQGTIFRLSFSEVTSPPQADTGLSRSHRA